jgi:hypothetical protein
MSSVTGLRDIYERNELNSSEADALRIENHKLYRLVLQLVRDVHELENVLGQHGSMHSHEDLVPR